MIFSNLARILAVVAFVFGLMRVTMGFMIATGMAGPYEAALSRYSPEYASSGELIDKGIYTILFAVALGTLAEISFSIRKRPA